MASDGAMMVDKVLSAISFLTSSSSFIVYVICLCVGAYAGWYVTRDHYEAEINSIKSSLALQAQKESEDYAKRLSTAISERDSAYDRIRSLVISDSDLRNRLLIADNRETARVKANPTGSYAEQYQRCRGLLRESLDLNVEGCARFGKCAADKDALSKLIP